MERELSITITVNDDGGGEINIYDNDSSDTKIFDISPNIDCNHADEFAKALGYELLSWVDIAREDLNVK